MFLTVSILMINNKKIIIKMDNNKKCFLSSKSAFLKDHVTLKMMQKINLCQQ